MVSEKEYTELLMCYKQAMEDKKNKAKEITLQISERAWANIENRITEKSINNQKIRKEILDITKEIIHKEVRKIVFDKEFLKEFIRVVN